MSPKRNWIANHGCVGAALAATLGLVLLWSKLGSGLVGLSYDSLFRFREDVRPGGVTLIYINIESEIRLKQKGHQSWDRAIHARLLERLKEFHPAAVVFDLLLVPSDDDPAADERLVRAARALGNVVVAAKPTADILEGENVGWQMTLPFPRLREAASWGVVEAADADKRIREHYHRKDLDTPSIAWRAAQRTMTALPADPYAERWINYYGPPGILPHFSYYEIFETNRVPLAALSNQVVFVGGLYDIGFRGGKRSDDFRTPYTPWTRRRSPGVEVTATAYLNIFRHDWLRRPPAWCETGLVVLCGGMLGWGLARRRPVVAIGLGALGFLLAGALTILVAWQQFVFFPWLIVGAVQIPCAVGWSVLTQTLRLQREKKALEQTLALAQGRTSPDERTPAWTPIGPLAVRDDQRSPVRLGSSARSSEPLRTVEERVTVQAPADLRPTVPDHELLRRIGKGAYGEVWLARDIIGTYHAVKVVYRSRFPDAAPFEREFNGIRKFTPISRSHPGFVHVLHVGRNERGDYLYYVMELGDDEATGQQVNPLTYSAKTLSRELQQRRRLPLAEVLQLSAHLADALDFLHRHHLIHRDIKPANIIFVKGTPKLADIGLVTDAATEGHDVTYLGTRGYIAPEGPGTPAADVFSLGRVIYEAGFGIEAGRFPELPTTIVANPESGALFQLNRIVLKACEDDVGRRYATAAELRMALAELLQRIEVQPKS